MTAYGTTTFAAVYRLPLMTVLLCFTFGGLLLLFHFIPHCRACRALQLVSASQAACKNTGAFYFLQSLLWIDMLLPLLAMEMQTMHTALQASLGRERWKHTRSECVFVCVRVRGERGQYLGQKMALYSVLRQYARTSWGLCVLWLQPQCASVHEVGSSSGHFTFSLSACLVFSVLLSTAWI